MPTFKKIPLSEKAKKAIVCGRYAIFCFGLLKASKIADRLQKADIKNGIPAYGYVTFKHERVYYCLYGFINDPDTYEPEQKQKTKKNNQYEN